MGGEARKEHEQGFASRWELDAQELIRKIREHAREELLAELGLVGWELNTPGAIITVNPRLPGELTVGPIMDHVTDENGVKYIWIKVLAERVQIKKYRDDE